MTNNYFSINNIHNYKKWIYFPSAALLVKVVRFFIVQDAPFSS